jgi:glutamate/tyrosine decarboxylase-like PLP-dependent enzyme
MQHPPHVPDTTSLDSDAATFRDHLAQASDIVVRLHDELDRRRLTPARTPSALAKLFDEPLPEDPQPMRTILREVEENVIANSTLYSSPRFFAYVNGSGNQAAILGELLAAGVNQICARWHFSPAASEVERRVIRWIAQFVGYPEDAGGCLLSGGSAGNLVGLALARTRKAPFDTQLWGLNAGPPLTAYVSQEGHASLDKAMALLGMGRAQLRRIAVHDDFTIDLEALEHQVAGDRANGFHPICVVGNGGTTNTGAVDPLDALAAFCRRHGLWFHVDAAYGGPAARTTAAGALFRGLDQADSIVVNAHKWLYVPVEAACILVRETSALRDTFRIVADYLREEGGTATDACLDFKDCGPQLSRSFRALKIWMTFKAYGARRLRAAIESNIRVMQYLADRIDQSADFVRLAPAPLSTVCFQYRTSDASCHADHIHLDHLNESLIERLERDGTVFLSGTTIRGRTALRACSVNHRLDRRHVDLLLDVIRQRASTC